MPSLLSIFYQAKPHQISAQPLDSKILDLNIRRRPPMDFSSLSDGIEVRRWFETARPKTVTVRYAANRRAEVPGAGSEPSAANVVTSE